MSASLYEIDIVVRGVPAAGKTHVAAAIMETLRSCGFQVAVIDDSPPPSPALCRQVLPKLAATRKVTIRTECPKVKR